MIKLYTYFRSSAAFRVRIALELKGLPYEQEPVHLLKGGGEQNQESYLAINPQGLVPTLVDNDLVITQSLAIIEYLEEQHPEPRLLPGDVGDRAWVRSIAEQVACDIHPLNNLRVGRYLQDECAIDEQQKKRWMQHWMITGFNALEKTLSQSNYPGLFCYGNQPTVADLCIVPQVFNAIRFEVDLSGYPIIKEIYQQCMAQPAFVRAAPENQPDAT